jgi:hypothetical protein
MFLFLALMIGQILKQVCPKIGLPFTSMMAIVGFLFGYLVKPKPGSYRFYKLLYPWEHMDPHVMLLLFMPALIFESAFNTDPYIFKHESA